MLADRTTLKSSVGAFRNTRAFLSLFEISCTSTVAAHTRATPLRHRSPRPSSAAPRSAPPLSPQAHAPPARAPPPRAPLLPIGHRLAVVSSPLSALPSQVDPGPWLPPRRRPGRSPRRASAASSGSPATTSSRAATPTQTPLVGGRPGESRPPDFRRLFTFLRISNLVGSR